MTLLRQRDPRLILAVCGLSAVGDFIAFVVLTVRVFDMTGESGIGVGALLLTMVLPGVVLAPVVGWLVDHFETRRVLVVTSIAQAVTVAALALTTNLAATFALAFLLGAGVAIARPAVFALLPRIAGDQVTELNAWYQMVYYAGASAGPAVGGFLIDLAGANWALLIDAATFVVLAGGAAALRTSRPPARHEGDGGRPSWRRSLTVITGDRVVLIVVIVTALAILMIGAANVGEVFLAKGELRAGNVGYGLLNASWTLGMVLFIVAVGRRLRPDQLVAGLLIGLLTASAMTLGAGVSPTIAIAVGLYLIGGGGNGIGNVALRSAMQHRIPEHQLGRAFAVFGGLASAAEISSTALGGVLVELAGVRGSLVVLGAAGAIIAIAGFMGYLRLPASVRAMPARAPEPPGADGDGVAMTAPGLAGQATAATAASAATPTPEAANRATSTHQDQASEARRPAAN